MYDSLALRVQGRGRLVQQQDRGVPDDGPGDGDSLLLAAAELHPLLAALRVVPVLKILDEVVRVGALGGFNDGVHVRLLIALQAISYVLPDGAREEHGLLAYQGHLSGQPPPVVVADRDSIQRELALLGVVQPLDQLDNRALSRAAGTDKGDHLPWADLEREIVQHSGLRPRGVPE